MISSITGPLIAYDGYKGESFLVILAFSAVLYIWIIEKSPEIKLVLARLPMILLALFFFPAFSFVASRYFLDGGVYYRVLWLIPFTIITAYALVRVISSLSTHKKRAVCTLLFVLMIAQGGSFIYLNPLMTRAQNLYHLPEEVIEVADVMHVEGRNVKAALPGEMLQFIRQYDPSINLAYGREALVDGWSANPLYDILESNPVKSYHLTDEAKIQGVEYIVLRTGTTIVGSKPIDEYEFSLLAQIKGYDIYIFDRAEFARSKKEMYLPLLPKDREDHYIPGATGEGTPYK